MQRRDPGAVGGNVLGIPEGTTRSMADGYRALIRPLPPGNHTVEFGGTFTGNDPPFTTRVTDDLTVR